jgi:hypothetical protein
VQGVFSRVSHVFPVLSYQDLISGHGTSVLLQGERSLSLEVQIYGKRRLKIQLVLEGAIFHPLSRIGI